MTGNVFHIQRFSLFDGPGVRTVVFLKGCPLHCIWCHNPEGLSFRPQVMYRPDRCIGCMECVKVCPLGCHAEQDGIHLYDRRACVGCGKCAQVCCSGALSLAGERLEVSQVLEQVLRDKALYEESGGGLTLSGGEPLAQAEFAVALLKGAKDVGLNTCVETGGYADSRVIREAAAYTDWFYYDYKVTGEELHRKLCGVSGEPILENIAVLEELGARVVLRCPIIPGVNVTSADGGAEHIAAIGELARRYDCIREVHLEPYHNLGVTKAQELGLEDGFDTQVPERAKLEQYCQQITGRCGKLCKIS